MKLKPAKAHEPVTILIYPLDQYSCFTSCIDSILTETHHPFKMVVIEANAPENIRLDLEKRKQKNPNIKIIYTDHQPRMAEALNLGIAHIQTDTVFVMHNNLKASPDWLSSLTEKLKSKQGIICPYISKALPAAFTDTKSSLLTEISMHGFLIKTEQLKALGEFNTSLDTGLIGLDFGTKIRAAKIEVTVDLFSILYYNPIKSRKGYDLIFYNHQWNSGLIDKSINYFDEKWDISLDKTKYLEWLENRRRTDNSPALELPGFSPAPKMDFRKFVQALHRA